MMHPSDTILHAKRAVFRASSRPLINKLKKLNNNLEVHPSGGSSSTWFVVALEIGNVGFEEGGWSTRRKTSWRELTTNSTHIMVLMLGLEPKPHWLGSVSNYYIKTSLS